MELKRNEPTPQLKPQVRLDGPETDGPLPSKTKNLILGAAAALALTVGAVLAFGGGAHDTLTAQQAQARATAFAAAQAAGPLHVRTVPAPEIDKAIAEMKMKPQEAAHLKAQISNGAMKMIQFSVYDDCQEDGDVVRISAGGMTTDILLKFGDTRVSLPAPADGSPLDVVVTGVTDPGGGITVAARAADGSPLPLTTMVPGQVVHLKVQ